MTDRHAESDDGATWLMAREPSGTPQSREEGRVSAAREADAATSPAVSSADGPSRAPDRRAAIEGLVAIGVHPDVARCLKMPEEPEGAVDAAVSAELRSLIGRLGRGSRRPAGPVPVHASSEGRDFARYSGKAPPQTARHEREDSKRVLVAGERPADGDRNAPTVLVARRMRHSSRVAWVGAVATVLVALWIAMNVHGADRGQRAAHEESPLLLPMSRGVLTIAKGPQDLPPVTEPPRTSAPAVASGGAIEPGAAPTASASPQMPQAASGTAAVSPSTHRGASALPKVSALRSPHDVPEARQHYLLELP